MKIYYKTSFFTPAAAKYRSLSKEFKKYLKAVMMLVEDAYRLDKKRFIAVIITLAAGVSLLGLSLGVLLKYVKHLEFETTIDYFGYSFNARDGYLLTLISFSVIFLLVLSAGMLFYSKMKTRDILIEFNLKALVNITEKFGWSPPDKIAWINDLALFTDIKSLYRGDAQKSALAMRRIIEGFQHLFVTLGGIVVLLWLDVSATFYLFGIIFIALVFYNKINMRASRATREHENISGESSRRSIALIESVSSWPNSKLDSSVLYSITHEGVIKKNSKKLFDRFATRSMTEFLSNMLTGIAMGFLVMILGYSAINEEMSWAAVVGYIIILKTVMQSIKSILKMLTAVARLYPGISRLYEFNRNINKPSLSSMHKISEVMLSFAEDAILEKSEKSVILKKGDIVGFSAPMTLSRYSVKFFEKVLARGKGKRKKKSPVLLDSIAIAVPFKFLLAPIALRDLLGVSDNVNAGDLRVAAGSRAGKIEKVFPLDPDTVVTDKDLKKLSIDSMNYFSLISCTLSDRPILLVHGSLITEEWVNENRTVLENRILIICYNGLPDELTVPVKNIKTYIVAAADLDIVAAGNFNILKKRKAAIEKLLLEREEKVVSASERVLVISSTEEEEDDDE